jgi:ATP-binding protein involved in chromosome partitioning
MSQLTREAVLSALSAIAAPAGGKDIVSAGMVSGVHVADGKAYLSITVPAGEAQRLEPLRVAAERAVRALPGCEGALVALTAEKKGAGQGAPTPAQSPQQGAQGRAKPEVPGVRAIVAVASGKGGVGKSTTAVNLALGLHAIGYRVGVLDADIYGPSIPRLLGIRGKPSSKDGRILQPMERHGLKAMSIGFLVEEETPMIWRGPMVISALTQLLREVEWGELDFLIVDMPPGTGDAQLTMAQQVPLAGAVIVSTPQDLALIDARKGLAMFRRVDVPVLGIVENMSYFLCPDCGSRHDIFSHGGARIEAERIGVPFLGELPLDMTIRESSDGGEPVTASQPDSPQAQAYRDIARKVADAVEAGAKSAGGPAIVFE